MVFQFVNVGNDAEGRKFLRELDKSSISKVVDTVSGSEIMDTIGARLARGLGFESKDLQLVIPHPWGELL